MMIFNKLSNLAGTVHTQYFHARFSSDGNTTTYNNTSLLHSTSATTCSDVSSGHNVTNTSIGKDENEVQKEQSEFQMYLSYAGLAPTIIGCVILGSSSDVIGRKFLILIPLIVGWLGQVFYLFFMWFDLDMTYTYVVGIISAIPGGGFTLTMGINAYTADLTPPEKSRTMAFLLLEYIPGFTSLFSTLLIGYLIDHYGFFKAALVPNGFALVCIGIVLWLPETVPVSIKRGCPHLGNPIKYAKNVFSFYVSAGTKRQRNQFRLALFILLFHYTCSLGYGSVFELYEMGLPFCWNAEKIAQYGAVSNAMHLLPHMLLVFLMQRFFSDSFIMAYALIPSIACHILTGLAQNSFMLYIVLVVGVLIPPGTTINKSILSRMADADKQENFKRCRFL
nr:hypothetical protein BaRGS_014158 [Batillaria attramentaria]